MKTKERDDTLPMLGIPHEPQTEKIRRRRKLPWKLIGCGLLVAFAYTVVSLIIVNDPYDELTSSAKSAPRIKWVAEQFDKAGFAIDNPCTKPSKNMLDWSYQPTCGLNRNDTIRQKALAYASFTSGTAFEAPFESGPETELDHSDYQVVTVRFLMVEVNKRAMRFLKSRDPNITPPMKNAMAYIADASRPDLTTPSQVNIVNKSGKDVQGLCPTNQGLNAAAGCLDITWKRSFSATYKFFPPWNSDMRIDMSKHEKAVWFVGILFLPLLILFGLKTAYHLLIMLVKAFPGILRNLASKTGKQVSSRRGRSTDPDSEKTIEVKNGGKEG